MSIKLNRRAVLKGLGGAAVSLPLLDCMLDGKAWAQGAPAPRRYALVFAGQSIGGDGYARDDQTVGGRRFRETGHFVVPTETGRGYTLTTPLRPLADLRDDYTLVSNLRIPFSRNSTAAGDVPPGGAYREFHGGGASPLISGMRSQTGGFTARGITSDQVVADVYRGQTTHDSLVLRAQPAWYLNGSSYVGRQYVSYRGDRQPVEAQTSPRVAWQSLFGGFTPDDDSDRARHDFEQRTRRSVLDLVASKRQRLLGRVGGADRVRLERHFDEIRDLERRIAALPPLPEGQCQPVGDPGADSPIGGDNAGTGWGAIGTNTGYSNEHERARLMADLIHMAFVCDLTRVATLQITTFQSHMNVFPITEAMGMPMRADVHEIGHGGDANNRGQLPVSMLLQWHISHYAYLLDKLKSTPEGDGNLLDHSAVVFLPEGGHGTQLNDASSQFQTHSVEDMIVMVAGRAGGLRPGGHLDGGHAHPVQVLISAMQAAGYDGDRLGEVRGNVPALFG